MEHDENLDLELEQQDEEVDSIEEIEVDESEDSKDMELAKAKAEAAKYRRLLEKAQKPKVEAKYPQSAPQDTSSSVSIEETVLLANGFDEELIDDLKAIAKVRNTSLIKAQKDPIFVAIKEKFEKDKKQSDASMPASRGSGSLKPKKDFKTQGLTRNEHKAMVESLTN